MATITREKIGPLNEKIVVKVAKDDYLPSFEKAIKNYSKQANIPGFRKGMVPVGMVKKMYGNTVFADEVIKSVEKGLGDYMANEKLEIFAQPLPLQENESPKLDMNQPQEYAFAFEVGLKPEFSIADLGTAPVTRFKIDVTDQMIDEEISRLQVRHGNMTEPESVTSEDNVLNLQFTETDATGNIVEGGINKDNSLMVKYFTPPFREQLMGKKKDDTLVVQLSQAFDVKEREWIINDLGLSKDDAAAADKFFKLQITKIGLVERNELNEGFFEQVFPGKEIKTEADFRNAIKEQISAQFQSETKKPVTALTVSYFAGSNEY